MKIEKLDGVRPQHGGGRRAGEGQGTTKGSRSQVGEPGGGVGWPALPGALPSPCLHPSGDLRDQSELGCLCVATSCPCQVFMASLIHRGRK